MTMKTDAITKCYAGLSLKERAALTFRYCALENELEMSRITSTVPRVALTGPPPEYSRWFNALTRAACWWAIRHWEAEARAMAAIGGHQIAADSGDMDRAGKLLAALKKWESALLALDETLESVAAEYGFDAEAVRGFAGAERYQGMFVKEPSAEDMAYSKEALLRVLTA